MLGCGIEQRLCQTIRTAHCFLDRAQEPRVTKHESCQLPLVYHAQAFTATLDSIAVAYVSAVGCWHYV